MLVYCVRGYGAYAIVVYGMCVHGGVFNCDKLYCHICWCYVWCDVIRSVMATHCGVECVVITYV